MTFLKKTAVALTLGATGFASSASADVVHLDDVIISGSLCVGQDCVNGESFGFDTIRLKENNVRIKFDDTSASASFPNNDWQLTANDSSNGGANKFSIDDITGGRTPFTIEARAPSNSLFVDDGGRIGLGTATPSVEIHSKNGDSPTLRLEQDGSSGFGLQTWDLAGNEANFFIRDVTNGSQLPFRIQPGADSNSIYIASDNDVGIGTSSPDANLHVIGTSILLEETDGGTAGADALHLKRATGGVAIRLESGQASAPDPVRLNLNPTFNEFRISFGAPAAPQLALDSNGNLKTLGSVTATSFIAGAQTLNVPDYVFGDDYKLMPLNEVDAFIKANSHLPKIPAAKEINANGLDLIQMQMALLEKVEELTLYTLQQEKTISALSERINTLVD